MGNYEASKSELILLGHIVKVGIIFPDTGKGKMKEPTNIGELSANSGHLFLGNSI